MPKCSYCGEDYDMHRGVTLVLNNGETKYLCSSKCRKNMKIGRRKIRWIHDKKQAKKVARKISKKKKK